MKKIRKNRDRRHYVYFCALKSIEPTHVDSRRCLLPAGHKVGGRHEHIAYYNNFYATFDQNCHELIEEVPTIWKEYKEHEEKQCH